MRLSVSAVVIFSTGMLHDGACIDALHGNSGRALELLSLLADNRYYAILDHLAGDNDLVNLHAMPQWAGSTE